MNRAYSVGGASSQKVKVPTWVINKVNFCMLIWGSSGLALRKFSILEL